VQSPPEGVQRPLIVVHHENLFFHGLPLRVPTVKV
jgi:hypothetical protein